MGKQIYATFYTQISHFILFTVKIFSRNLIFLLRIKITEHNKTKIEWGCRNGTKYPTWQPIQTPQVMRAKPFYLNACVRLQTNGQGDSSIPP